MPSPQLGPNDGIELAHRTAADSEVGRTSVEKDHFKSSFSHACQQHNQQHMIVHQTGGSVRPLVLLGVPAAQHQTVVRSLVLGGWHGTLACLVQAQVKFCVSDGRLVVSHCAPMIVV